MPQIHLTKELLNKETFADVLFVVLSAPSAMGNGGLVQFITRNKTEYYFNFLEDELKCSDVEEVFPPINQFKRESERFEDWHLIYLGVGTSMAIKDEVFETFRQIAKEYPQKNYMLFVSWRKIALETLKSIEN